MTNTSQNNRTFYNFLWLTLFAKLKQQEYEVISGLNDQKINYLEDKIQKQEILIKELTEKADLAMQQVQSINVPLADEFILTPITL